MVLWVLPVPGAPAMSRARPAIFLALISSTTRPAACVCVCLCVCVWFEV
jgi:hypothetical protein